MNVKREIGNKCIRICKVIARLEESHFSFTHTYQANHHASSYICFVSTNALVNSNDITYMMHVHARRFQMAMHDVHSKNRKK